MDKLSLKARPRELLGRKVKQLRREGLIPGHVFGHNIKTVHVSVEEPELLKTFEEAGETSIIDLKVDHETRPVLIRGVQNHPLTDKILHVDFYQVSLKEKVKVEVPLEIIGESPAIEKSIGVLLTPVSELEVEALPQNLPEKIEIDISKLENVGDAVHVKDLKIDREKIEIHADEELVVANIGELVTKEAETILAEEAAGREAVAEEEAAQAPTEGEEKPSEETEKAETGEKEEPKE